MATQAAMIALCLVPIVRRAVQDWEDISGLASQLKAPALLASLVALILASLFLPAAVSVFTRGAANRIGYRHSALAYFGSQPMKYLPGSFWILPGRVILLRGLGHDLSLSSAGLIFEMTTQVLSSSLVAIALLGLGGFNSVWYRSAAWLVLAGSFAASVLLVAAPALIQRVITRPSTFRQAMAQLADIPLALRLRNLLLTTACFSFMWCLMGASFYALIVATDPHLDLVLLKVAIGVSTLSWLAGFLAPFSPGGVGVREAAIVLLLNPFMAGPQAVIVALLSRVLSLAVELAFAAGAWLPLRSARAPAARP
jgi:uncharacterized membrane protein YbhN (UPF0104 family)